MWRCDREVQAVWDTVGAQLDALPDPLPSQWREDEEGMSSRCGGRQVRELCRDREMFPSLPLIWWTASALGFADGNLLHRLGEGALMAYLHFRLHDDVVDGHATTPGGLLTANLCLDRFHVVYRSIFPAEHPLWALWSDVLTRYSATTLWELRGRRRSRRGYGPADLDRLGEKFIPVLAPCAGVAFLAHHEEIVLDLRQLILVLGSGLQLLNDHKGIVHDFQTSSYTSVITDILAGVPRSRELESAAFPRRALTSDAMGRNLERSSRYLELASQVATRLRMAPARAYIDEIQGYLEAECARLAEVRRTARAQEQDEDLPFGATP